MRRGSRKPREVRTLVHWGFAARPCPHGSPSRDRGSRCAAPADQGSSRHAPVRPPTSSSISPLRAVADHLAQEIDGRALLHDRTQVHHVVAHLRSFGCLVLCNPTLPKIADEHLSAARYGAPEKGALYERLRYRGATPPPGTRPHDRCGGGFDPGQDWTLVPEMLEASQLSLRLLQAAFSLRRP